MCPFSLETNPILYMYSVCTLNRDDIYSVYQMYHNIGKGKSLV